MSKVIASMATGGVDTVNEVGLPSDLAFIYAIEEYLLLDYPAPDSDTNVNECPCALWAIFENAVNCVATFADHGGYLYTLTADGTSPPNNPAKVIDLIAPASWDEFDRAVRYLRENKTKPDWWKLPRNEMAEGIRRYRAENGLETSESLLVRIMKWVDRNL